MNASRPTGLELPDRPSAGASRPGSGKATHRELKRHNRRMLLHAIVRGGADSRAALAQATGLTKPTVSSLVGEMIEEGLLVERGRGPSGEGGGKRPRLLEFRTDARQVVGAAFGRDRVAGVLCDLAGRIAARHEVRADAARDPAEAVADVIEGLAAQLDAPLLGVGVGVAGRALPPVAPLEARFGVPVRVANRTELAALGRHAFAAGDPPAAMTAVLVDRSVEVGFVLDDGRCHGGGDVGDVRPAPDGPTFAQRLGRAALDERVARVLARPGDERVLARPGDERALAGAGGARAPAGAGGDPGLDGLGYLPLREACRRGEPAARALMEEVARDLATVAAWGAALHRPERIAIAGTLTDLGEHLLEPLRSALSELVPPDAERPVEVEFVPYEHLGALGAAALALRGELGIP